MVFHRKNGDGEDPNLRPILALISSLVQKIDAIEQAISAGKGDALPPVIRRQFYSTAEFSARVDRAIYTVRQWCLHNRVNAVKAGAGRGVYGEWRISHEELDRYLNHGLLPLRRRGRPGSQST